MRYRIEIEFEVDVPPEYVSDGFTSEAEMWLEDTTERISNLSNVRFLRGEQV